MVHNPRWRSVEQSIDYNTFVNIQADVLQSQIMHRLLIERRW